MRVQIFSDAHTEFMADCGESFVNEIQSDAEILVIAGDLATFNSLWILKHLCRNYENVLFTNGNHELYGSGFPEIREKLLLIQQDCPNLTILDRSVKIIKGQRFVGATLWFEDLARSIPYQMMLNDFSRIRDFSKLVFEENKQDIKFLSEFVEEGDIVVTHHLPLWECVAEQYKGNPLNDFFVCDMRELIEERKPKIWVHGHSHSSHDFVFNSTRIIRNPFGYLGHEENRSFDWNKIVEI